jgi:hypothetical protein
VRVQWYRQDALDEVNRLGAEGWEPFAASDTRDGMTIFMRRARAESRGAKESE